MVWEEIKILLKLRWEKFVIKWQMKQADRYKEVEEMKEQLDHKRLAMVKRREDVDSGVIESGLIKIPEFAKQEFPKLVNPITKNTGSMPYLEVKKPLEIPKYEDFSTAMYPNQSDVIRGGYGGKSFSISHTRIEYKETKLFIPGLERAVSVKHITPPDASIILVYFDMDAMYIREADITEKIKWIDIMYWTTMQDRKTIPNLKAEFYSRISKEVIQCFEDKYGEFRLVIHGILSKVDSQKNMYSTDKSEIKAKAYEKAQEKDAWFDTSEPSGSYRRSLNDMTQPLRVQAALQLLDNGELNDSVDRGVFPTHIEEMPHDMSVRIRMSDGKFIRISNFQLAPVEATLLKSIILFDLPDIEKIGER